MRYISLILLIVILSGCGSANQETDCAADPRCVIYGITSDILILDPHISDSVEAGMVFRQIYDTLVYQNQSGQFVAGLAESWEISEDGLEYTFSLRTDVQFHDGTPFNAQAVATNIDRIFDPNINSPKARLLLGAFSRYEVVDEYTIRIYLFEPYIPLLDGLSQPYLAMLSPQSIAEYEPLRYQYHQVGTGPYKLEKYLPGDRIVLTRNPDYRWYPSIYTTPAGTVIERVEFRIITDVSTNTDLLLDGSVDIIDEIPPSDARNLASNSDLVVLPIDIPGQSVMFYFNTRRQHTDNPIVRRALLLATNRVSIADTIYLNFSPIAWSPLAQTTQYAHTGYVNLLGYDLTEAQKLLESAGYIDSDEDGFLDLDGEKLEIDLIIPPWGQLPEVGDFLREQWRTIGVDLVINPTPGLNSLLNQVDAGNYHLVSFDLFGLDPSLLNSVFATNGADNALGYSNEELDDLLVQATQEQDGFTRRSLYFQIQSIVMDDALVLPIRDYVNIVGIRGTISNLKFDAFGWYPLLYDARLN